MRLYNGKAADIRKRKASDRKALNMEEKKDGQTRLKLEELFAEIEDILEQMDDKEISLEKSFLLYEEGMKKLKQCNDKIDQVEKKMQVISEQGLEEF